MHFELKKNKREWEVTRTVKHDSNGMEFDVKFGFKFTLGMHLLKLRMSRY